MTKFLSKQTTLIKITNSILTNQSVYYYSNNSSTIHSKNKKYSSSLQNNEYHQRSIRSLLNNVLIVFHTIHTIITKHSCFYIPLLYPSNWSKHSVYNSHQEELYNRYKHTIIRSISHIHHLHTPTRSTIQLRLFKS